MKALFRKGDPKRGGQAQPRPPSVRRNGGWFGGGACPDVPRDPDVITEQDMEAYTAALTRNGFFGPDSWYMNHKANGAYAKRAKNGGKLVDARAVPARRLRHDLRDRCTRGSPSRCGRTAADLTEVVVNSGHWMAQEQPVAVNAALAKWLATKLPDYWKA